MVLIDCSDYSSMSFDDIFEEIKGVSLKTEEGIRNMSWALYDLLPVGTVLQAAFSVQEVKKVWISYNELQRHIYGKPSMINEGVTVFPSIEKGDVMMFLGMTPDRYLHEYLVDVKGRRNGRPSPKRAVVNAGRRPYPRWLIGEKVYTHDVCMTHFTIMKMGSGKKATKYG